MARTQKQIPVRYKNTGREPYLSIKDWFGLNLFDTHSTLLPGYLRDARNIDLFKGSFKSRKGSTNLNDTAAVLASEPVRAATVWDVGAKEYAIIQCDTGSGSKMRYVELSANGTFQDVTFKNVGGSATLASDAPATLFIKADRCYVFHEEGNRIIQYLPDTDHFEMRTLGLAAPTISSVSATAGVNTGRHVYAVELCYQEDGVDIVASSPNRIMSSGALAEITLSGQNGRIQIDPDSLPSGGGADDYWTHVKLYKSGNLDPDFSDPSSVREAETTADELFYVKTISRADLATALYVITDDVLHEEVNKSHLWKIDSTGIIPSNIELSPLPPAKIGCFHGERIWVGRCPSVDPSESILYYSNFADDQYAESYDPLFNVPIEKGDGQKVIVIVPYENDLLVIKQGKTGIILDGNPSLPFQVKDPSQGISHKRLCAYVPLVGICAITTDNNDFKIFDSSMRWVNVYGSQELSRMVRSKTAALVQNPDFVSFTYINGKLKIWNGETEALVLHVEQGKGWTTHSLPINTSGCEAVLTFAGNSRECIISSESYILETEKNIDTDLDTTTGLVNRIAVSLEIHRFQNKEGRDLLEYQSVSVSGTLSAKLHAIPYVDGQAWPIPEIEESTAFIPDPSTYEDRPELQEGIYELYLRKRPVGHFIHLTLSTKAPCTIRSLDWKGFLTEDMPYHRNNRIRKTKSASYQPEWLVNPLQIYDGGNGARDISLFRIFDAMDSDGNDRDLSDFVIIDRE